MQATHRTFLRQRVGFGAELVLYVLFPFLVVISLVFASVATVALIFILVFAGRNGASSAGGTYLTALPEKHMQVTSMSGMLHVGRRSASSFPTSKFSCVITVSIPRPAGRKARLESRIEESHLLRQNIALLSVQETGNGSAHTWWRQRNHPCFCCMCVPMR